MLSTKDRCVNLSQKAGWAQPSGTQAILEGTEGEKVKDLHGKVAVVTGGGSGIGAGMVRAFAEAGMHVVVADIEVDRAEAIARQVADNGQRAIAVDVDVTDYSSVVALADRAFGEFGTVHLLCNNAGVMLSGPMLNLKVEDWHWVFEVNVFGVVHGIYAFVPRMITQDGEAHIVNTASMSSFSDGRYHSPYTASKHACGVITEALRGEMAEHGIGVSGLYPGGVATDIMNSQRNRQPRYGDPTSFEIAPSRASGEMAADVMEPTDVGRLVRQAVIDNAAWIFTHPHWLQQYAEGRWEEIRSAAADQARERGD